MSRGTLLSINGSMAFIQSLMVDIEVPSFEVCAMSTQAGVIPRSREKSRYFPQPEPLYNRYLGSSAL